MSIRGVLRSPLLHFFLLGGLIFGAYALKAPPLAPAEDTVLRLTEADADRLADGFFAVWGRAPSQEESRALVRDWAIEEAMVREARALGLDEGDAMIRNRLRAKMEFLAEAPAAAMAPDEATLLAFYEANARDYTSPARMSFVQVLLPAEAGADVTAALRAELEQGANPAGLGQATMLPPRIDAMAAPAVERVFGAGFGDAVASLPPEQWAGPVPSAYGQHLVRLGGLSASALPPLDAVRERVLADWRADQARRLRATFTEELMSRYRLELPGAPDGQP